MSMNPEIKQQWVEALRSDKYKQGKNALAKTDSTGYEYHCCLGVLCELAVEAGIVKKERYYEEIDVFVDGGNNYTSYLPGSVMAWAGLVEVNPRVELRYGGKDSLAAVNDRDSSSFPMIADLIENQL